MLTRLAILLTIISGSLAHAETRVLRDAINNTSVFTMPMRDIGHARDFISALDSVVKKEITAFVGETGLVEGGRPAVMPVIHDSVANLDRRTRKGHITSESHWYYRVGRHSASAVGVLANGYAQPLSHYHRDPKLLKMIENTFNAFADRQTADGDVAFCPLRYGSVYGSHEMAWRVENFIVAWYAIRNDLDAETKTRYWTFLSRWMQALQNTRCDHSCNRGMVWLGVMSMCYRATDDISFLNDARDVWKQVRKPIFFTNGQVNEGHGPDAVYSPISYEYLIRFRMMTDDTALDPIIRASTRWMSEMYTEALVPFQGLSTRYDTDDAGYKAHRLVAGMEFLAQSDPAWRPRADAMRERVLRYHPASVGSHGAISWATAGWLHTRRPTTAIVTPDPVAVTRYSTTARRYYTVSQTKYQAMLTLKSTNPRIGLQTWAVRGSAPFICPDERMASTVRMWGYDLAHSSVSKRDRDHRRSEASGLYVITTTHGRLRTTYVLSPSSTIIIHSTARPELRETVWRGSKRHIRGYRVEDDHVIAAGAAGALYWTGGEPVITTDGLSITFRDTAAVQAYALASGTFGFTRIARNGRDSVVHWRDSTGRYSAQINHARGTVATRREIITMK